MKLSPKMQNALNAELNLEFESWYAYLAMAAWCEATNLDGFATWLRSQATEEVEHAMKFYSFILDRGGKVELAKIGPPKADFSSPIEVFEAALGHEQKVSEAINQLYGLAVDEKDFATQAFLDWFVTEQIEEEKTVGGIVESLRRVGKQSEALLLLDREAGSRSEV